MKTRNISLRLVAICLLFLSSLSTYALEKLPKMFQNTIGSGATSCNSVVVGQPCANVTADATPKTGAFRDYSVRNTVTLGVDHANTTFSVAYKCQITVLIERWDKTNPVLPNLPSLTKTLTVNYNPYSGTNDYIDQASYSSVVNDGNSSTAVYKIKASITAISLTINGNTTTVSTLPSNLYLNTKISLIRYEDFTPNANTNITMSPGKVSDLDCISNPGDEFNVNWVAITGAEEYQLEWTFINDYDVVPGKYLPSTALKYDFRNNSTRITTLGASNNYTISNSFDHGYLVCRVRAIGRDINNPSISIVGKWNLLETGLVSALTANQYFTVTLPYDPDKSWQYSSTFAEEGKKKEVLSFFDGSLRNRQSVTKTNSDQKVIVGETIYDHQGRPAVNVLPAPVFTPTCPTGGNQPSLKYYANFNTDNSSPTTPQKYLRDDFDLDANPVTDSCNSSTGNMGTKSGASNYYSSANPIKTAENKFLPDAEMRPFSQNKYTPDNTGRIKKQGGVGVPFQIGSGRETDYIYGQPNQLELDRMFGSEVGDAAHYKKNVVIDANDQSSISYLDQEGRVIATCLAADTKIDIATGQPVLEKLPSEAAAVKSLTIDLFGKDANLKSLQNTVNTDGDVLEFNSQLTVAYKSNYTLNYNVSVDTLGEACLIPAKNICFNCIYDLQIRITDDCGKLVTAGLGTHPVNRILGKGNFSMVNGVLTFSNANCVTPTLYSYAEPAIRFNNLLPGNYTISKILTLNKTARDYYVKQYLDSTNNSCIKKMSTFRQQYLAKIDTSNCFITCAKCATSLGKRDDWVANGKGTAMQYDFLFDQCNAPCKAKSLCDIEYEQMLQDLAPTRQYAQFDPSDLASNLSKYPLSIYNNTNNGLPSGNSVVRWKTPSVKLNDNTYPYYLDANGTRSVVKVIKNPTTQGDYIPKVSNAVLVYENTEENYLYTYPENLFSYSDFIANWKSNWAKSLVIYHPEYRYYQVCEPFGVQQATDVLSSSDFDARLSNAQTFTAAIAAGFIKSNYASIPYASVETRVNSFFTYTVNPAMPYDPYTLSGSVFQTLATPLGININSILTTTYTTYRNSLSMLKYAALVTRCGNKYAGDYTAVTYANGCYDFGADFYPTNPANVKRNDSIRDKEWNMFKTFYLSEKQQLQKRIQDAYANANNINNLCIGNSSSSGPCYSINPNLYATKQKRFVDMRDLPFNTLEKVRDEHFLQSGQCPMAVQLEALISRVAQSKKLTLTGQLMSDYAEFTPDLYNAATTILSPSSTIPYNWNVTSNTSTDLSVNIASGSNNQITINLTKPAAVNWNAVVGISKLTYTSTSAGLYNFYAQAQVLKTPADPIYPFDYIKITGTTKYNITCNPTTKLQSKEYPIANDITQLLTTMINPVNKLLANVNPPVANAPSVTQVPKSLKYYFGLENAATTDFRWLWGSTSRQFALFDWTTTTSTTFSDKNSIKIRIYDYSPIAPTVSFTDADLSTLVAFNNPKSLGDNMFTMVGLKTGNVPAVTITAEIYYESGTGLATPIAVGTNALPDPGNCISKEFEATKQFKNLLTDVLTRRPFDASKVNLFASSACTKAVTDYFPVGTLSTTSSYQGSVATEDPDPNTFITTFDDRLKISLSPTIQPSCDIMLKYYRGNIGLPQFDFSNIVDITDFKGVGNPDSQGNYYDFSFTAFYKQISPGPKNAARPYGVTGLPAAPTPPIVDTGNVIKSLQIFGSSCIPIRNCYCTDTTIKLVDYPVGVNEKSSVWKIEKLPTTNPLPYTGYSVNQSTAAVNYVLANPKATSAITNFAFPFNHEWTYGTLTTTTNINAGIVDKIVWSKPFSGQWYGHSGDGNSDPTSTIIYPASAVGQTSTSYSLDLSSANVNRYAYYRLQRSITVKNAAFATLKIEFAADNIGYLIVNGILRSSINQNSLPIPPFAYNGPSDKKIKRHQVVLGGSDLLEGENTITFVFADIKNAKAGVGIMASLTTRPICPTVNNPVVNAKDTVYFSPPVGLTRNPCAKQLIGLALLNATTAYNQYMDSVKTTIVSKYTSRCMRAKEDFTAAFDDKQYHYTLYYYDAAGNLVKTVPPEGVNLLPSTSYSTAPEPQIIADRTYNKQTFFTAHTMETKYVYNSLNQLVKQVVPDHETMNIWDYTLPNGLDKRFVATGTQFLNANRGYMSGSLGGVDGMVYMTEDGGQTWKRTYNIVASNLKKIEMTSATNGVAVGEDGVGLSTTDGGQTWRIDLFNEYATKILNDIESGPSGTGSVAYVGNGIMFIRTGVTTNTVSGIQSTDVLNSVTFDNTFFYAAGTNAAGLGIIYKVNATAPHTATLQTKYRAPDLNRIRFVPTSATIAYAAGIDGTLLSTIDAGTTWLAVPTNITGNIRDLFFTTQNIGVAIIETKAAFGPLTYGQIFKTIDGGKTWELISKPDEYFNSMSFYLDNTNGTYKGVAVGNNSIIRRIVATPAGKSPYFGMLEVSPLPNNINLLSVSAQANTSNTNVVILVGGENSNLYVTKNGADRNVIWASINTSAITPTTIPTADAMFTSLSFKLNASDLIRGALITKSGKLYTVQQQSLTPFAYNLYPTAVTSTDNFTELNSKVASGFYTFNKVNKQLYNVIVSENNGTASTITPKAGASTIIAANSLDFDAAATNVYLVGAKGEIFRSPISTIAWTDNSDKTVPLPINDIQANGANNIYAVGNDGSIIQTTNGGTLWTTLPSGTSNKLNAIKFNSITTGLIVGEKGTIFTHAINGNTITLAPPTFTLRTNNNLNDIALSPTGIAYIAGDKGTLIHIPNIANNTASMASPQPTNVDFSGVSFEFGSTANLYTCGKGAAIYKYTYNATDLKTTGNRLTEVFTPAINALHFTDLNNGFIVGNSGTIRSTNNAGTTWRTVMPLNYATVGTPSLTSVYTMKPGSAIVAGNGDFLGQTSNNAPVTVFSTTYNYTGVIANKFTDIQFHKDFPNSGYATASNKRVFSFVLNTSNSALSTVTSISVGIAASPAVFDLNALHIFRDNTFIAVGTAGQVHYCNPFPSVVWTAKTTSITGSPVLNDVYFHDDRTGYVVGDAGTIYKTVCIGDIQALPSNFSSWIPRVATDGFNITANTNVDIKTIAFPDRYDGILAGNYASSFTNNSNYPYVRALKDEADMFSTRFFYDKLGRMIVSQNTKQFNKASKAYSYTLYDGLGRIVEVGEKAENTSATKIPSIFGSLVNNYYNPRTIDDTKLTTWITDATGVRTEITRTFYDNQNISLLPLSTLTQKNLRKRVASVVYQDTYAATLNSTNYQYATHYSYDIHGNVNVLLQDNPTLAGIADQRYKQIDYDYDLISGAVQLVSYQKGKPDRFFHKYSYDADNRIILVQTSKDSIKWDQDAKYFYYAHGPLARTEIGDNKVQGIDYAYTLQGWIKGVNSNLLKETNDMGQDGLSTSLNKNVARDAFGYTLGYYQGDYKKIDAANTFEATLTGSALLNARNDLYNGNISSMVSTISQTVAYTSTTGTPIVLPQGTAYKYDQLNRLSDVKAFTNLDAPSNAWTATASNLESYRNTFTYDANGNILTQMRKDQTGGVIDNLTYNYFTIGGKKIQNRLYSVNDATITPSITDDIENQGVYQNGVITSVNRANNYRYDEIGNLKHDSIEQIQEIKWTVYGKIKEIIRKSSSTKNNLKFDYDASGNRIAKHVLSSAGVLQSSEYYMRDAQGNVMSIYKKNPSNTSFMQTEKNIYGSSRLGSDKLNTEMVGAQPVGQIELFSNYLGIKQYELSNHLANVLAVVSDKRIPRQLGSTGTIGNYEADIVSSTDYNAFGSPMNGRNFSSSSYRYGFNGKENDNEIKGSGNSQDYGMRIYDPRLGRFLSVDPITKQYPELTPYQFASNTPIQAVDRDGEEALFVKALVGAFVGGGVEFVNQIVKNGLQNTSGNGDDGKVHSFFHHSLRNVDYADVLISSIKGALNGIFPGAGAVLDATSEYSKAGIDFIPGVKAGKPFKILGGKNGHSKEVNDFTKEVIKANANIILGVLFDLTGIAENISTAVNNSSQGSIFGTKGTQNISDFVGTVPNQVGEKIMNKVLDNTVPPKSEEAPTSNPPNSGGANEKQDIIEIENGGGVEN